MKHSIILYSFLISLSGCGTLYDVGVIGGESAFPEEKLRVYGGLRTDMQGLSDVSGMRPHPVNGVFTLMLIVDALFLSTPLDTGLLPITVGKWIYKTVSPDPPIEQEESEIPVN